MILKRGNHCFIFKDTLQINKLHTFVNEWNFDKMSFKNYLEIDIRTMEILNITPSQKSCFI